MGIPLTSKGNIDSRQKKSQTAAVIENQARCLPFVYIKQLYFPEKSTRGR